MIFFYGAYGFTGKQIFDFLRSDFPLSSRKVVISGRSKEKLANLYRHLKNVFPSLEIISIPSTSTELETRKIDGIKLVVNTAGPFSETGEIVLKFAIQNNANYIDCTGEWIWTKTIMDYYNKILKNKKLFASSGVAWESVSGEICVNELIKKLKNEGQISQVKKINLIYLADFAMSRGTLRSSIKILKSGAIRWQYGEIENVEPGERVFSFEFDPQKKKKFVAVNLSTSDVINVPLSLGELSREIEFEVFFASSARRAFIFARIIKLLRKLLLYRFSSRIFPVIFRLLDFHPNPDEHRVKNRSSAISFAFDKNDNLISSFEIKATKPYYITAKILAFACSQFEKGNYKKLYGYVPPTSLFDFPREILD